MNVCEFVEKYGVKNIVCCFSGGKDSLAATHLTHSMLENSDVELWVATVDTTVMIPPAIEFVKDVAGKLGWRLVILKPQKTFWEFAKEKGAPKMRKRWCCYWLKQEPIFRFVKTLKPPKAIVTGLRRSESRRRSLLPQLIWRKECSAYSYAPIIDWTDEQVSNYIRENGLPTPPWYKMGIREACMCGAFSSLRELQIVKANWPSFFSKFVELEESFMKGTCFYLKNRPYPAKEIAAQKTLEEDGETGGDVK